MANAFDLQAVLTMDSSAFDSGLQRAGGAISGFMGGLVSVGAAAVGAAASGVTALTSQAVSAYGQYEQMAGGISKLFGTAGLSLEEYAAEQGATVGEVVDQYNALGDAYDLVMEHAANAFATSGRSANEYMETVTSFSGSLIRDLEGDTLRAAEISDIALRDMSDNVNTYGTSMEMVQNAYTGLMRQNFTMIDNLNLGFQGTAAGMADLMNASGILEEGIEATADNIKDFTFDQYIEAIHAVQTQMHISGLTAEEAADMVARGAMTEEQAMAAMGTTAREGAITVQGSTRALQAAWENLMTGLGDSEADLGTLVDNVVNSFMAVVNNIEPIALQAVNGIATVIERLAPIIESELPPMIERILPAAISAIMALINGVVAVLPSLIRELVPPLISASITVAMALLEALPDIISMLSDQIPILLNQVIPAILTLLPEFLEAGFEFMMALMQGIMDNIDIVMNAVMDLVHMIANEFITPDNILMLLDVMSEFVFAIAEALLENAPELLVTVMVILSNIVAAMIEWFPTVWENIKNFLTNLGADVYTKMSTGFPPKLAAFFNSIMTAVGNAAADLLAKGANFVADCIEGIGNFFANAGTSISDGFSGFIDSVTSFGGDLWTAFTDIWTHVGEIVADGIQALINMMDFDWHLPQLQLPHFTITGGEAPWGFGGQGHLPSVSVDWYAKAMANPMLLTGSTIFGYGPTGHALGGGEAGDEMIYGRDNLMRDITEAVSGALGGWSPIVNVYIGNEKIDDLMVESEQRTNFRSGGRG